MEIRPWAAPGIGTSQGVQGILETGERGVRELAALS